MSTEVHSSERVKDPDQDPFEQLDRGVLANNDLRYTEPGLQTTSFPLVRGALRSRKSCLVFPKDLSCDLMLTKK